jgi:putative ABC transport system ATP-binding protein
VGQRPEIPHRDGKVVCEQLPVARGRRCRACDDTCDENPQTDETWPLTVLDNVLLPAQLAGLRAAEARARAATLLEFLRIDRHARGYPGRLSGGERQRVAVARALMNRPALLLADEPTGALDTASGHDVQALLAELNADGQSIVLVTHDPMLAASCTDRTVELVDGRIVRDVAAVTR